jgi:tetratricopeptide (TPR) repeat protein
MPGDTPIPEHVCSGVWRQGSLLKSEYVVGEPLLIALDLRGEPMVADREFTANLTIGADLKILLQPPGMRRFEYLPDQEALGLTGNLVLRMKGDERLQRVISAFYDPDSVSGALLETPGTYQIRIGLVCAGSNETRRLETVYEGTFTVVPGSGDDEAILDFLSFETWQALHYKATSNQAVIQELEQALERFPQAAIRPQILMTLANTYFLSGRAQDPANYSRSLPLLEQFVAQYPESYLYPFAANRLLVAYLESGNREEGLELFSHLWSNPDYSAALRRESPIVMRLFGEPKATVVGDWSIYEEPQDAMLPTQATFEQQLEEMNPEEQLNAILGQMMQQM